MKFKLKNWLLVGMLAVLLVVAACSNGTTNDGNEQAPANQEQQSGNSVENNGAEVQEESSATTYPLTVTDATGTEVTLAEAPDAIVSIAPSETEVLFAIGAGEFVVGVDEYSNYPPETSDIAKVGDMNTNIEAIMGLNPDIVFANSSMSGEAISKLRELGLVVYGSDPLTYDETVAHIQQVGVLLNKQENATAVADEMQQVKNDVTAKVAGLDAQKVYLEFSPGWTFGTGVFIDDLVNIAGGVNIASEQSGWFEVDAEVVIEQNPQVIIYPDFGEEQSSILAGIMSRPGWDVIDAVKQDRLVEVNNDPLVRVGPRLSQGLLDIAAAIHPELFQ